MHHVPTRSETLRALRVLHNERRARYHPLLAPSPEQVEAAQEVLRRLSSLQLLEQLVEMENVLNDALSKT